MSLVRLRTPYFLYAVIVFAAIGGLWFGLTSLLVKVGHVTVLFANLFGAFVAISLVVLSLFVWLFSRLFFIVKRKLMDYRRRMHFLTTSNQIFMMEYDVISRTFTRWNAANNRRMRSFPVEKYWSYLHPDDLPVARQLINFMDSRADKSYVCEYRYLFPNAADYSWQSNSIFPYERDKSGRVISYLGVCRSDNRWHQLHDNLANFYSQVSQITTQNGIDFLHYHVASRRFYHFDSYQSMENKIIELDDFINRIHPDNLPKVLSQFASFTERNAVTAHAEFRMQDKPDGDYRWYVMDVAASAYDEHKRISDYIMILRDDDVWKRSQEELNRFRRMVSLVARTNGVLYIQYLVKKDIFVRMDDLVESHQHDIPLDVWFSLIHPQDQPIA